MSGMTAGGRPPEETGPESGASTRALVRRWAVDWLASHDATACQGLLDPDYRLTIGAVVIEGRENYVRATLGELAKFPGLGLTVHEVVVDGDHAAVRFTEHGAAVHREGRLAAWSGVAVFEAQGGLLRACWAEEDYASRSAQLASGSVHPIEPPDVAPWDGPEVPTDAGAQSLLRDWLAGLRDGEVLVDGAARPLPGRVDLDMLVCAGRRAGFHGRCDVGGFGLGIAGIVSVNEAGVVSGHLVTDRSGLKAHRRSQQEGR